MNYLLKINHTFYFRLSIPKDLQTYFPSKVIKRSLHTSSKTQARKLLNAELYGIQQIFYNLRLGNNFMHQVTPSKKAIEIYKKRYGADVSIHEEAQPGEPCIYGTQWKFKPELLRIQAKIDAGYIEKDDGYFWLKDAPPRGLQTVTLTAPYPIFDETTIEVPVAAPVTPAVTVTVKPSISLAEARDIYLKECEFPARPAQDKAHKKGTLSSARTAIKQLATFMGSEQTLLTSIPDDLYPFTEWLADTRKLNSDSLNTRINRLSDFFGDLKEWGYIENVPVLNRYLSKTDREGKPVTKGSNIPYTNEQLNMIFKHYIENVPVNLKTRRLHLDLTYMLLALLHTGFRIEELQHCRLEKYTKADIPVLYNPFRKNDNPLCERYVPIHSGLIMLDYPSHFNKRKITALNDMRKYHRHILDTLGIRTEKNTYTLHSCRKNFDTKLAGKIDGVIRKRLMGHSSKDIDETYVKQPADDAVKYQEAVNELVYDIDYKSIKEFLLKETEYLYGKQTRPRSELIPAIYSHPNDT